MDGRVKQQSGVKRGACDIVAICASRVRLLPVPEEAGNICNINVIVVYVSYHARMFAEGSQREAVVYMVLLSIQETEGSQGEAVAYMLLLSVQKIYKK